VSTMSRSVLSLLNYFFVIQGKKLAGDPGNRLLAAGIFGIKLTDRFTSVALRPCTTHHKNAPVSVHRAMCNAMLNN
jgi:hypothetical protein